MMVELGALLISIITFIFYLCWPTYKAGGREIPVGRINIIKTRLYLDNLNYKEYIQDVIGGVPKTIKYFDEIPHNLPYESFDDTVRHTHHIGQLKLFLTEVEFLTEKLKSKDDHCIMLYAGSAPCHHASYLSDMFPNLKMIMVDPNEHWIYYPNYQSSYDKQKMSETVYFKATKDNKFRVPNRNIQMYDNGKLVSLEKGKQFGQMMSLNKAFDTKLAKMDVKSMIDFITKSNHKYYIIEDFFTDEIATMFSNLKDKNFLFCSDIRSKAESTKIPGDLDLLWNLAMQYNWLNIMKPSACMLKFRCPFLEEDDREQFLRLSDQKIYKDVFEISRKNGIDFVADYKAKKFRYIKPDNIYIQAFPGVSSSESRLIASDFKVTAEMDPAEYENKFFYYNRVLRHYGYHNEYELVYDAKAGFDACGDCALMYQIMKEYYEKFEPNKANPNSIKADIDVLMKTLRRDFKENGSMHGKYLEPYKNVQSIIDQQREYILYGIYKTNESLLRSAIKK